jgi:hypothetical protein
MKNPMKNAGRVLGLLTLVGLICVLGCTPKRAPRSLYEKDGAFSFDPPSGWTVKDMAISKYRIAHGPPANGFAPNLNVVRESYSGSLKSYANANLAAVEKAFQSFKLLSREEFQTADGESAMRLRTESSHDGKLLRQTFYLYSNGRRKYVMTGSALAEGGASQDAAFDESGRSFRMH